MSNSDKKKGRFTVSPEMQQPSRLRSVVTTVLVVVAILLVAFYFVVRTNTFRVWVEEYLEKQTGMQLVVERTRIGWPYDLVIEGLRSEASDGDPLAGVITDEIRVGLGIKCKIRLKIRGCTLKLLRLEDGTWSPGFFARLGELKEIEQIADLTESFRRKVCLEIIRGSIRWFDADNSRIARVEGVDFTMAPHVLKRRITLYHCCLTIYDFSRSDGGHERDFKQEWFFTDDGQLFKIGRHGQRDAESGVNSRP